MAAHEPPPLLDLEHVRIDATLALRVPESLALRRRMLLFGQDGGALYAACADPDDLAAIEALERVAGGHIVAIRAEPASLERALGRVYHRRAAAGVDDAVRVADELLRAALLEQASDIHLEPAADSLRVRFRIDGVLELQREIPTRDAPSLFNRLKVLAGMDISEKRLPQDGRFTYAYGPAGGAASVDVRAAVLPTKFGERMTLRLLAAKTGTLTLSSLGMAPDDLDAFRRAIRQSHGLVLLTGPTGSGKTTTLYGALRELDLETQNVLTIEDPIEYDVAGVSQVEVDSGDRVTFARALRSVLRHDPDVLMIGEIRDLETADVAVKASLTGHLVLSTLHTNTAASTVTRLVDMGVPRYLVGATLRLAVAQRLVRRLCARCRRPATLAREDAAFLGRPDAAGSPIFEAAGCAYCKHTGFVGRVGVFEVVAPTKEMASAIAAGADEARIAAMAREARASTLQADASEKILAGVTTPLEVVSAMEADA